MTFCMLAGLSQASCQEDPLAAAGGLPPIDSRSVWALVTGQDASPVRTELPIDGAVFIVANSSTSGPWYKLFTSPHVVGAGRTGPVFPNSTSPDPEAPTMQCARGGCLFDIWGDEAEEHDIAAQHPELVASMGARLSELAKGFYSNSDTGGMDLCPNGISPESCLCWAATNLHGGFLGPFHKWD